MRGTAYLAGKTGGARAYLCGSSKTDLYHVGDGYASAGNGPVPEPHGAQKFGRADRGLIYANDETQRDRNWAGHDKAMSGMDVGSFDTKTDPSIFLNYMLFEVAGMCSRLSSLILTQNPHQYAAG